MSDWNEFDPVEYMQRLKLMAGLGGFRHIDGFVPWNERFALFRHNYRVKAALVDAGMETWFRCDPYRIADWASIFTPIESAIWSDIRCAGICMWPQLPVGRFFLDFGNPVAKIAIECDGHQFHQDKAKDAARDAELAALGWEVLRIPGWRCKNGYPDMEPDMPRAEREARQQFINEKTPAYEIDWCAYVLAAAEGLASKGGDL